MEKSFRLSSDGMFSRPEEIFLEMPLRIIFLSVEGNVTEQNYFSWLEKYREKLGIKTGVGIAGRIYRNKRIRHFTESDEKSDSNKIYRCFCTTIYERSG